MAFNLKDLYHRLRHESDNTATGAMLQSDVNRNVLPGKKSSWAGELTPTDLAQLDRYSWGKQAGLGGLPTALYSEAVKIPAIQKPMSYVSKGLGKVLGYPQAEEWYKTDENSSPASWDNVKSYTKGALDNEGLISSIIGERNPKVASNSWFSFLG